MTKIKSWVKASRLPSQSYIFFPLLLGQMFYYEIKHSLNFPLFIIIQIFGLFIQLYIVYANDYADYGIDMTNDTYNIFSGGSRVLVEKHITVNEMKNAIKIMVSLNIFLGIILTLLFGRNFSIPLIIISLLLLWAYSYPPIKLSYRGGGELLQVAGVAVVLPVFGYYIQAGTFEGFPWIFMAAFIPIQIGCAMSTSLPDYPSDKAGKKKTSSVILGFEKNKISIIIINFISFIAFVLIIWKKLDFLKSYVILLIPILSNFYLVFLKNKAKIGSNSLDKFVAVNIIIVISFTAGNAICMLFN